MRVIAISGHAGNGKDTAAVMMREALEARGKSVLVTHYADPVKFVCKNLFGWNGLKDNDGRTLLQRVGTDVVRSNDPNYWVNFIGDMLTFFRDEWEYVLIPDARFPNELTVLTDRGFDVTHIRVVRDNFVSSLSEEQKKHPSETALDDYFPDYYIMNDGSLEDLAENIRVLLEDLYGNE